MDIKKVVVVGGGSAGWMTASALVKFFPDKEIVVVEDPDTPAIGVGESTYDGIRYFCKLIGVENDDFFLQTDASLKIGISFADFYKESGEEPFLYPFGSPLLEDTRWHYEDWLIKKVYYPETPVHEFVESYFPQANLAKIGRFSDNKSKKFGHFNPDLDAALHFDAIKFGEFLRDSLCIPAGVKHLQGKVKAVVADKFGIESLTMEDGSSIIADLFVDCTGFKSMLLGEALKEPFNSYEEVLPNNKAWATRLPYKNKATELRPVTTSTGIENGWVWDIPLWSRLGTGYVYSDKFVSDEDALAEFKKYLASDKMVEPRTEEEIAELEFNNIQMRVGIHERTWVKNVVAIGLSAGFIEPLESNGLFTVHEFIYQLLRALQRGTVSSWDLEVYNRATLEIYNNFANFIRMHYALSLRKDTPYWKANFDRGQYFNKSIVNMSNHSDHLDTLYESKTNSFSASTRGGLTIISVGMNYPILDPISVAIGQIKNQMDYRTELSQNFRDLDAKRMFWQDAAKKSDTLLEYLEKKYHRVKSDIEEETNDIYDDLDGDFYN
jgi:tryptophan halogenase